MDFGLNLILTFTDRATSGLNGAASSLQSLQTMAAGVSKKTTSSLAALSYSADMLGNGFMNVGSKITSSLAGIISQVNQVGNTVYSAEMGIGKLYAKADASLDEVLAAGQKKVSQIQDYAAKTLFNFEDMIPIVQMLKANGIEAFDTITSSSGKSSQMLMDYAADLAFFNKQMRNAYGTGIQAAMGAINEYIAEGNKRLLKAGASLDITALLGESVGDTIEERSRQVADLLEQLNLVGMTNTMGKNDPSIMISNLDDKLFIFESHLAKSGIRDEFVKILSTISEAFETIDDSKMKKIADSVGDALATLMKPLEWGANALSKFITNLSDLLENHPKIAKFAITATALAGALFLLFGVGFKLISVFARLGSVFILAGVESASMFGMITGGFSSLVTSVGPLVGLFGGLWLAWHTDLFGLQTMVFDFVSGCIDAWKVAVDATSKSAKDMMEIYNNLDRNSFFGNLTSGLIKAIVFVQALADAWSDGKMDEELYQKAVDVGVIDLVSRILDLKYRVEEFFTGFKEGWNEANESIRLFVEDVAKNLKGTIFEDIFNGAEKFFTLLTEADLDDWRNFGKDLGELAPKALAFGLALRGIVKAASGLSTVGTLLGGLGKIKLPKFNIASMISQNNTVGAFKNFGKVMIIDPIVNSISRSSTAQTFSAVSKALVNGIKTSITTTMQGSGIGSTILNGISTAIQAVSGASAATIGAVVAGIVASVLAFAFKDPEGFTAKITQLKDGIVQSFSDLWDRLKLFFEPIEEGIGHLKEAFGNLVDSVKDGVVFQTLVDILADIGRVIMDVVVPAFNGIVDIVTTVFGNVVNIVSEVFGAVIDIISGIVNIISGIFSGDLSLIVEGVAQIFTAVVNVIGSIFEGAVNVVVSIVNAILHTGLGLLEGAIDVVRGVFNLIVTFIGARLNTALTTVQNIVTSILNLLGFSGAAKKVSAVFDAIKGAISNALNEAKDIVNNAIDAIKGAFNFSWKLPELKLPHINVTGGEAPFGIAGKGSLPDFSVSWYKEGGVFDQPSVIGVGEAGTEAVMPLEQNIGWIDLLASKILGSMSVASPVVEYNPINNIEPATNDNVVNVLPTPIHQTGGTVDNSTNSTDARVDNSVTFNEGSIVIQMNGSNDIDIHNLAIRLMNEIARVQQIRKSTNYNINYAAGGV